MTAVAVIGANGFVGSAFVRLLGRNPEIALTHVTRETYAAAAGRGSYDVVIDCAANSRKYVAEERPLEDFQATVEHRLRTLLDFPAALQVHVSSVDVYPDLTSPATTHEDTEIDVARTSRYGFHKLLAEQIVRRYAREWLIVRLSGMVGPGLRKNPVYDVLHGHPLRIHPDSRYQFLHTDEMAAAVWRLVTEELRGVFNVAGRGTISPREISALTGRPLDESVLERDAVPRVVDVEITRIERVVRMPETTATVARYCRETGAA